MGEYSTGFGEAHACENKLPIIRHFFNPIKLGERTHTILPLFLPPHSLEDTTTACSSILQPPPCSSLANAPLARGDLRGEVGAVKAFRPDLGARSEGVGGDQLHATLCTGAAAPIWQH